MVDNGTCHNRHHYVLIDTHKQNAPVFQGQQPPTRPWAHLFSERIQPVETSLIFDFYRYFISLTRQGDRAAEASSRCLEWLIGRYGPQSRPESFHGRIAYQTGGIVAHEPTDGGEPGSKRTIRDGSTPLRNPSLKEHLRQERRTPPVFLRRTGARPRCEGVRVGVYPLPR